jgi:hypothetical protein
MTKSVAVGNFRTKLDAEIAAGLLDRERIPYRIQSTEGMLHGPIAPGATIYVPGKLEAEARQILSDAGMIEINDG